MDWYAYEILPIDFGWDNLKTVEETARSIAANRASALVKEHGVEEPTLEYFLECWKEAQSCARGVGWEGDFRHEPVVFWLPAVYDFQFGFVFKQDNNGDTYVVSPVALPHLEAS